MSAIESRAVSGGPHSILIAQEATSGRTPRIPRPLVKMTSLTASAKNRADLLPVVFPISMWGNRQALRRQSSMASGPRKDLSTVALTPVSKTDTR
jgi:hypothetical protein